MILNDQNVLKAPAPWDLTGEGYIFLYAFGKRFSPDELFVNPYFFNQKSIKYGAVMLVNYHDSPVGPYGELLLIPSMYRMNGKLLFTISKIYVDSESSLYNGRKNWGIPKELATFDWHKISTDESYVEVRNEKELIYGAHMKSRGMAFPITTSILPFTFIQPTSNQTIITSPKGKGKARFARPIELKGNKQFFPDLSELNPLLSLHIQPFRLTFPIPKYQ